MRRFNLSEWAVHHQALVLFLIIAIGVAGFFSYQRLGRAEDPSFTIKVAVVTAFWPGATAQEMQQQVADPIEKKLQELPYFDKVTTYSKPSFAAMQIAFRDNTPAEGGAEPVLSHAQEAQRPQAGSAGGRDRPERQRRIRRRRLDPLYGHRRRRRLRAAEEGFGGPAPGVARRSLASSRSTSTAPRTRRFTSSSRTPSSPRSASSRSRSSTRSPSRTRSHPAASSRPPRSASRCASPARSTARRRWPRRRSRPTAACSASATSPLSPTASRIRPTTRCASAASPRSASASSPPRAPTSSRSARKLTDGTNRFMSAVPQGIDIEQIADQPEVVDHAVSEFTHSFIEALAIVLFVSFVSLGWRTGIVVAASVPLVLAIVFVVDERHGPRSAPHHARRADHRARPTGRRRHHRGRDDGGEDGAGLGPAEGRVVRLGIPPRFRC